jgi:hypothetical protein
VVNIEEVVPDAPLPLMGSTVYRHIGTPVDFSGQYLTTYGNHGLANCYWYAINHQTQPQRPIAATMLQQARMDGLVGNVAAVVEAV